jgi:signal transduction histidine kinase
MDHHDGASGTLAELATSTGLRSSVGVPIVVDGRLWGIVTASWTGGDSPPADTEARMARFAQLLDTAIANADSRDQLTASRARLLTAADDARRRVVRDLHDGAQQRFVHTIMTLKFARRALQENDGQAESLVSEALEHAEQGHQALRELAHGILPAVLDRGLGAAFDSIAMRLDLPVAVDVSAERLPADIEASAYFIVAEALTNIVKHAQATRAAITASVHDGMLRVEVRDDGVGGADADGHGLVGMADRVTALGGRLELESPSGGGTLLAATLPLSAVHW